MSREIQHSPRVRGTPSLWVVLLFVCPIPRTAQDTSCTDRLDTGIKMGSESASCSQLKAYCTRTRHADMVREVCPATCGVTCTPTSAPKDMPLTLTAFPTDMTMSPTLLPLLSTPPPTFIPTPKPAAPVASAAPVQRCIGDSESAIAKWKAIAIFFGGVACGCAMTVGAIFGCQRMKRKQVQQTPLFWMESVEFRQPSIIDLYNSNSALKSVTHPGGDARHTAWGNKGDTYLFGEESGLSVAGTEMAGHTDQDYIGSQRTPSPEHQHWHIGGNSTSAEMLRSPSPDDEAIEMADLPPRQRWRTPSPELANSYCD